MEENGTRARSFRFEDSRTRRVFLRSYPLHWGDESEVEASKQASEEHSKEAVNVASRKNGKTPIKKLILVVFQWGEERVFVFRRLKNRITVYVLNCIPVKFKVPKALLSL
ncbi:Hypothetical predicted protein [Olea europaea subsp. europaea]|uniref:Uncharacterized protein n=1 Tax=Olea europaea subsp. europaea TaxID=158383 RepID=A0A8S0SKX9_OLEEU|nr:Hypothetical predicted protein [Olea europaea subsp. europaea]